VTVNPFSRWTYKEWPLERWRRIIGWLWRAYGILTVVVGSPDERIRANEEILGALDIPAGNLAGKTSLGELAALLKHSFLHIGVDSGAPHIAAAVGTPTVTLYGPSDWREWSPAGVRHRVVTPAVDCAPCLRKGCDGGGVSRCLDELPAEHMETVLADMLDALRPPRRRTVNH
jgi:heptosyltransferase-3